MSCIKSLPELCRLGIARVGIRTLLLVLFTYVTQHTAVLLGNSSTLNKRGENPPRCNRTTPAVFSLANPSVNAQTIFSFSAVMAFHEALTTEYPPPKFILTGRSIARTTSSGLPQSRRLCGKEEPQRRERVFGFLRKRVIQSLRRRERTNGEENAVKVRKDCGAGKCMVCG